MATPANLRDQDTAERWLRLGAAATYAAPPVEAGFSVEQTVTGAAGVPVATVYRLVMRVSHRLF